MLDLTIEKDITGFTPIHFGVNVELQEYADQINLWAWLADSGSTIVRELHPEQSLRKAGLDLSRFNRIAARRPRRIVIASCPGFAARMDRLLLIFPADPWCR